MLVCASAKEEHEEWAPDASDNDATAPRILRMAAALGFKSRSLYPRSYTTPQACTWSAKGALAIDHLSVAQHKSIRRVGNYLSFRASEALESVCRQPSNTCCYRRSLRKRAHAQYRVASLILWVHA